MVAIAGLGLIVLQLSVGYLLRDLDDTDDTSWWRPVTEEVAERLEGPEMDAQFWFAGSLRDGAFGTTDCAPITVDRLVVARRSTSGLGESVTSTEPLLIPGDGIRLSQLPPAVRYVIEVAAEEWPSAPLTVVVVADVDGQTQHAIFALNDSEETLAASPCG